LATTHQKIEQGARSREALLDAAIELIADGGYTATGVDAIARRSGVVKSALYWHFGSKDGLLIAALERTAHEWVAEFESSVVVKAEPAERLENLLGHVRRIFFDRPERVRLILSALIERGPENREVREGVSRILGVIRDAIQRGMSSVLPIPPERVQGLATLTLQTLTGAFFDYFSNPDPELFEQRLKVIRKMLIIFVDYELKHLGSPNA
jgi:AcrR family transcriptional regulator